MLKTLKDIFECLNKNNIKYVHWKSNEHLLAALEGDTDLDILVSYDDFEIFVNIIHNYGFSFYKSIYGQDYLSVFDYILLDPISRKILHIHLHCRFISGKKYCKEYSIPIEDVILDKFVTVYNGLVKVTNPAHELISLWIRFSLKTNCLLFLLKGMRISEDFIRESEWLKSRVTNTELQKASDEIIPYAQESFKKIQLFLNSGLKNNYALSMIKTIRYELRIFRTSSFSMIHYLITRISVIAKLILKRIGMPIPFKRINIRSGTIIAFIGSDGSGKSTITKQLAKVLSKKVDVYEEYFGSGDGKCSLMRLPMLLMAKFIKKFIKAEKIKTEENISLKVKKRLSIIYAMWALVLAAEKKQKLKNIKKAKAKGMIVICDRYPQTQICGINDGPLLCAWKDKKGLMKFLYEWELSVYKLALQIKPDLIIKLNVNADIAKMRKPFENQHIINKKVSIIKSLKIPAKKNIEIDANGNIGEVLYAVFTEVSKVL